MRESVTREAEVREERRRYTAGVEDGRWGLRTLEKEGKPKSP